MIVLGAMSQAMLSAKIMQPYGQIVAYAPTASVPKGTAHAVLISLVISHIKSSADLNASGVEIWFLTMYR